MDNWENNLQQVCGLYRAVAAPSCKNVIGKVLGYQTSGLDIADISCNLRSINRNKSDIAKDSEQHFFLLQQKQGQCRITQRNQQIFLATGDFALMDSSYPVDLYYDGKFSRQVSYHLPASAMHNLRTDNTSNFHLEGKNPKAHVLSSYLANIFSDEQEFQFDNEKILVLQNLVTLSFIHPQQHLPQDQKFIDKPCN